MVNKTITEQIKVSDVILDVPYYSEFDEIDGSTYHIELFKRRSCGIVSVKMVLDFWSKKGIVSKVTLKDLIKLASSHHAYSNNWSGLGQRGSGWVHSGMVKTLQDLGFTAWRRMWFMRNDDKAFFKREGLTKESLEDYYNQILAEAVTSFKTSIDSGNPFLVSILKNMGVKKSPHFIVITGYKLSKGNVCGLYLNDPHNPKNGKKDRPLHKNQFISLKEFDKIWRKRAIFVKAEEKN